MIVSNEDLAAKSESLRQAIEIVKLDEETPFKKPSTVAADVVKIAENLYEFFYWNSPSVKY